MTRKESHELMWAVAEMADHAPAEKVIRAYDVLSRVMPDEDDRVSCERVVLCLREVLDAQANTRARFSCGNPEGDGK